jgi:hypothetical protein
MVPFAARGKTFCLFFREYLGVSLIFWWNVLQRLFFVIFVILFSHLLGYSDLPESLFLFQAQPPDLVGFLFVFPRYCQRSFEFRWWSMDFSVPPINLRIEGFQPWVAQDNSILSKVCDMELRSDPFVSSFNIEVDAFFDETRLVVGPVNIKELSCSWKLLCSES